MTTFEVEAAFVGHDLNRGTSEFHRRKLSAAPTAAPQPAAEVEDRGAEKEAEAAESAA